VIRLCLEAVEARELLSTVYWINPDGGDWAVPENWSTGQLPRPDEDVVIDLPGNITVTHSRGAHAVRSLLSAETLAISGGSLALAERSEANGPLVLTGGLLTGPATLTATDIFLWTGGTLAGTGRTVANGGLVMSGTAGKVIDGRTVENGATAVWVGAGNITAQNGALFRNRATGTFLVENAARFQSTGFGAPSALKTRARSASPPGALRRWSCASITLVPWMCRRGRSSFRGRQGTTPAHFSSARGQPWSSRAAIKSFGPAPVSWGSAP
jgi:hypothetical protein